MKLKIERTPHKITLEKIDLKLKTQESRSKKENVSKEKKFWLEEDELKKTLFV